MGYFRFLPATVGPEKRSGGRGEVGKQVWCRQPGGMGLAPSPGPKGTVKPVIDWDLRGKMGF